MKFLEITNTVYPLIKVGEGTRLTTEKILLPVECILYFRARPPLDEQGVRPQIQTDVVTSIFDSNHGFAQTVFKVTETLEELKQHLVQGSNMYTDDPSGYPLYQGAVHKLTTEIANLLAGPEPKDRAIVNAYRLAISCLKRT